MAKPEMKPSKKKPTQSEKDAARREWKLNVIIMQLNQIQQKQGVTMATLEELQAEVAENTSAVDSASRLITGLADQLEEALQANDPAAVQAVVDQLRANNDTLAEAVAANTEVNPESDLQ